MEKAESWTRVLPGSGGMCTSSSGSAARRELGSSRRRHTSRWLAAFVLLSAAVLAVSCSAAKPGARGHLKDYNLVLIVVDALRADHLGAYGYRRDTSPFIDKVAAEGTLFEKAFSNSSFTQESISVLFSGRLPSRSGSTGWGTGPAAGLPTLGEILRQDGYRTGLFAATAVLKDDFSRGFDEVDHLDGTWKVSGLSEPLTQRALEFARSSADDRFFMYLHYLDPHGPYEPPQELHARFAEHPPPRRPLRLYADVKPRLMELLRDGFGPGEPRFEDLMSRYDAEIADVDRAIERLFDGLEELGLLDNTLVVITADHGEEFLEHGYVGHAWTLYRESLHVPLIFWARGALESSREDRLVSHVDLLPTIVELLGVSHEGVDLDGTSLFSSDGAMYRLEPAEKPVFAELLIGHRNVLRTVITPEWKYLAVHRWVEPAARHKANRRELISEGRQFDIWGPVVREEIYNLIDDPLEQTNLVGSRQAPSLNLRLALETYVAESRRLNDSDSMSSTGPDAMTKEELRRLRALGYIQ